MPSHTRKRKTQKADAAKPQSAELVYLSNFDGGIARKPGKRAFRYYDADGRRITDRAELDRIAALAIPPAYTDVLISVDPNSHLQATGRDARGRKQYRYHPEWSAERGKTKFAQLPDFAARLPKIREKVDTDLRLRKPGMEKALATVVWLLDNLYIRVGNANYAEENGSYGLTTLRNRHVKIEGSSVHFNFKGKSGKEWRLSHNDRRITKAIRALQELPGQQLFQYLDEDGNRRPIRSQDVNAYIREAAGADFSSRQFRTWGATRLAAVALAALEPGPSQRQVKRQINDVVDAIAARLVNTRAVCRSSYIHPKVFEDFESGELASLMKMRSSRSETLTRWMDDDEIRVQRWLKKGDV
ncbi:DNA topoisomerase IB [Pararhizobium sp. BT-229]|uniref:DNA topoisomerase IB n=1 Tax=Pararhizobium sp. BT-229 TaxID=2986923 RepID=UPI0021F72161|nr:DNA topoisomerase IB [Pararhizobium sp. BT-229]MCV9960875.1 DNA topoisomerase IB [Pararhizobium sp. BT-229]